MENFGVTFEHSVNGTYGKCCEELVANLPSNYIAVGYRPPVAGEWFLRLDRHADRAVLDFECPRLILRPKPKMRTVTIEVEEGKRAFLLVQGPPRVGKYGDHYYDQQGARIEWLKCHEYALDMPLTFRELS